MTISWLPDQLKAVSEVLDRYPAESNRCESAAREILPIARELEETARARKLVPIEGRFLAPMRGVHWWEHVAVHVQQHVVDALTGAHGTPEPSYLGHHYRYPDRLVWRDWDEKEVVVKQ
ncbi:MAG TPA: hypothetical protein VEU33_08455 [Archangium sp.]|nr:hypothetical protein [Archangium sp.]